MSRVDKKAIRNLERLEIRNTLIFLHIGSATE